MSETNENAVGYKRPPVKNQFSSVNQPKRSGTKRQRVLATTDLADHFHKVLAERINISANGTRKRVTKAEYLASQIVNQSLTGPLKEMMRVAKLIGEQKVSPPVPITLEEEPDEEESIFNEGDMRFIETVSREFIVMKAQNDRKLVWCLDLLLPLASQSQCDASADYLSATEYLAQLREEARACVAEYDERHPEAQSAGQGTPMLNGEVMPKDGMCGLPPDDFYSGMIGND